MGDFLTYFVREWRVIWQAPITFIAAIIVAAGTIYWAMDWRYGGVIDGLNERIGLRDDQIQSLKDKVGTSSPDEIKARIDRLEAQVHGVLPRRLTDAQRNAIADILRTSPGQIEIAQDIGVADARPFAGDLILAFQNAGWTVQTPMILGPGNPPPHGVGITVPDPNSLSPRQALIIQALRSQGIQFDIQRGTVQSFNGPPIPGQPQQPPMDASILVSQKVL
jgi:hypothetical protein